MYDNTKRYCLRLEPAHRDVSRRLGLSVLLAMIDSEGEKPLDLRLQFELVAGGIFRSWLAQRQWISLRYAWDTRMARERTIKRKSENWRRERQEEECTKFHGVQLEQIGDSQPGKVGWGGRRKGVNDMYTQTGRAPAERKGNYRGKQSRVEKDRWRNSRLGCLGTSDGSQSSCLLSARFPSFNAAPTICVLLLLMPSPSHSSLCLSHFMSASFVRRARTDAEQALF